VRQQKPTGTMTTDQMSAMIPTPRTDQAVEHPHNMNLDNSMKEYRGLHAEVITECVPAELSRQLERELAQAKTERDSAIEDAIYAHSLGQGAAEDRFSEIIDKLKASIIAAEQREAGLLAALEKLDRSLRGLELWEHLVIEGNGDGPRGTPGKLARAAIRSAATGDERCAQPNGVENGHSGNL